MELTTTLPFSLCIHSQASMTVGAPCCKPLLTEFVWYIPLVLNCNVLREHLVYFIAYSEQKDVFDKKLV